MDLQRQLLDCLLIAMALIAVTRGEACGLGAEPFLHEERVRSRRLTDGIRVSFNAPVDEHALKREANGATQISRHIEKPSGIGGVLAGD
jgi:hypothetical protein